MPASGASRWRTGCPERSGIRRAAEYVGLWLKSVGHESLFFWYVAAVAALVLAASAWMPDTRTKGYLDGSGEIESD